jgi:hypothetical protein
MTIQELKEKFESGELSPAETFAHVASMEKQIKQLKEDVYDAALDEAREFNKDERYHGVKWEIRSGRTIYDFEADPEYSRINNDLKDRRKLLTDGAKMKASNRVVFDPATGEEIESVPVKSVGRDILVVKL